MRDLTGMTFVLTGRFQKKSRDELGNLIYRAGGTYARLTASVDYLVVGKSPGSKYVTAKNLGVEILTEEEFLLFLDGQEIVREQVEARSADELLGEVRGVMQGPPSAEMWHELVTLIDACREEDVPVLARYIDDYIARWTDEQMRDQQGTAGHEEAKDVYAHAVFGGSRGGITGELRVAPDAWVGELQRGEASPKFELVRALDLRLSKLNASTVNTILTHPQLTHLERVELPEFMLPSMTLIKTLCTHDNTTNLSWLKLGKIDAKTIRGFKTHGQTARALQVLDLSALNMPWSLQYNGTPLSFLFEPWCASTTRYILDLRWGSQVLDHLDSNDTTVRHLELVGEPTHGAELLRRAMTHTLLQREGVRVVSVPHIALYQESFLDAFCAALSDSQARLEVLSLGKVDLPPNPDVWTQWWDEHASQLTVLAHAEVLELGEAGSPHITELLARHYPDLTVR